MNKILTIVGHELIKSLRHPNRGILLILFYGVLVYLGMDLVFIEIWPSMEGVGVLQWMIPNLILAGIMVLSYLHANWQILEKQQSGYLLYLRSTTVSRGILIAGYTIDAILRSLLKSLLVVILFWILWGKIGEPLNWMMFYVVSISVSVFWAGLGISTALRFKRSSVNTHLVAELLIPLMVMSGFLFPVTYYPAALEIIISVLPTTQAFHLGRAAFGIEIWNTWFLLASIGWGVAGIILAVLSLQWEERV